MHPEGILKEGTTQLGVRLSDKQRRHFQIYLEELQAWNNKANLTSVEGSDDIVIRHFLDSISCVLSKRIDHFSKLVDIGAGAGFPGIPIKIVSPSICLVLVDSVKKKTDFLTSLVEKLCLTNTSIIRQRAEEYARESSNRETYDIVVARAVSELPVIIEYGLPLLKPGGALIAQKGKIKEAELKKGARAATLLGGSIAEVKSVEVPFLDEERNLVIVEKQRVSPLDYPRRVGVPSKRPLGETRGKTKFSEKEQCY